jgi:hypothetical protein
MRSKSVALAAVAIAASIAAVGFAALYFTRRDEDATEAAEETCDGRIFGRISELTTKDGGYVMRLDPSFLTTGVTANTAAAEDGAVDPGDPVPNDNYEVDEGKRTLVYLVPNDAAVTVLTNDNTGGILSTPVTVAELRELVEGGAPVKLFEPLDTGFWVRTHGDTVCALDQQYKP